MDPELPRLDVEVRRQELDPVGLHLTVGSAQVRQICSMSTTCTREGCALVDWLNLDLRPARRDDE